MSVFTSLGPAKETATVLGEELQLHNGGAFDFLSALNAMKFFEADGNGDAALYHNAGAETSSTTIAYK